MIAADTLSRLIVKDVEDYVPAQDDEETVALNKMTTGMEINLVDEQWKDPDLQRIIKMMDDQQIEYFDGTENPASDIKTLVELAARGELLVERNRENKRMLMKKASLTNQMVIPRSARAEVMKRAHLHHRGMSTTVKEIKRRSYWPGLSLDVAQMVCRCSICLEKAPVNLHNGEAFDWGTSQVWEKVYVDLLGPFSPLSDNKYKYVLTILDAYSRYIQAIPLENKRAEMVAEALIFRVLMNEGPPGMIYSDQGTEFKNVVMNRVVKYFGLTQKFSLANSPWTNAVERTHRTIGQLARMLQAKKMKDPEEWSKLIVMACHSINNSVCLATGVCPSYLFKGQHVKTPLNLMFPKAEKEPRDLPEAVQDLRRDYQMVQEAVKLQQGRNYNRLQKLYTGDEVG